MRSFHSRIVKASSLAQLRDIQKSAALSRYHASKELTWRSRVCACGWPLHIRTVYTTSILVCPNCGAVKDVGFIMDEGRLPNEPFSEAPSASKHGDIKVFLRGGKIMKVEGPRP